MFISHWHIPPPVIWTVHKYRLPESLMNIDRHTLLADKFLGRRSCFPTKSVRKLDFRSFLLSLQKLKISECLLCQIFKFSTDQRHWKVMKDDSSELETKNRRNVLLEEIWNFQLLYDQNTLVFVFPWLINVTSYVTLSLTNNDRLCLLATMSPRSVVRLMIRKMYNRKNKNLECAK